MSKRKPTYVQQLCRGLRPHLRTQNAKAELKALCKIKHRSQFDRWFPRTGIPPDNVRLTARVALRATRWWAEKQIHPRYVPSWAILRAMGAQLLTARRIDFVKILANYVGGGITTDQIYSYFSMRRREPDGEFALRFLRLMLRIRGIAGDSVLSAQLRAHPDWPVIAAALDMEKRQGIKRRKRFGRPLYLWSLPQRRQRRQRLSIAFKQMEKKPRTV
jgi:hypothetical protein